MIFVINILQAVFSRYNKMNFSQWFQLQENEQMDANSILYVACVLNKISQSSLIADMQKEALAINGSMIPQNWIKRAHHMTIKFKPNQSEVNSLSSLIGQEVHLTANYCAMDNYCIAVVVENDKNLKINQIPHITIAHSKDVKPVYSNTLLADKTKWKKLNSPIHLVSYLVGCTNTGTIPEMPSVLASQTI